MRSETLALRCNKQASERYDGRSVGQSISIAERNFRGNEISGRRSGPSTLRIVLGFSPKYYNKYIDDDISCITSPWLYDFHRGSLPDPLSHRVE